VRAVLSSLVDLARRWGALVVAEGVETQAQLAMAGELAIDAGQGYLLGRPGDRVDLERIDIAALLAPSTDPFVRLGLERPEAQAGQLAVGQPGAAQPGHEVREAPAA
jgi:hypothetical protein